MEEHELRSQGFVSGDMFLRILLEAGLDRYTTPSHISPPRKIDAVSGVCPSNFSASVFRVSVTPESLRII